MKKAFYAFPAKPASLQETICEALKVINKKNLIDIQPWTEIKPTGKIIITQVLKKIDECELFLYELSDLNPNVCFELGYAISKNKKIWGSLDKTKTSNIKLVGNSNLFSLIGYREHLNHEDIIKSFCKDKPYLNIAESFISQFKGILQLEQENIENKEILYLKSPIPSTASKKLSQFLTKLNRKIIEIDILENSYQPFEDILINVLRSKILIVHLLNNTQDNYNEINAIYAFIAGLGIGFNKETIMLAPEPYKPPMDYRHLLYIHETAKKCVEKVSNWIYPILSKGTDEITDKQIEVDLKDTELSLIKFVLGDGQAEHEENELHRYFIETSQYHQGLNERIGLFIGRKGTGKTANLYKIREHFLKSKENFVVTIKPQSFRLETYVKIIAEYFNDKDIHSHVTERIWEFIIYSSVLYELYDNLKSKPTYYDFSNNENKLLEYVEENIDIITSDFGEKIDYLYKKITEISKNNNNPKSIIEIIFNDYLREIKNLLTDNLTGFGRIVILIDNLDKAWDFGREIELQCKIIYGLIGFHNALIKGLNWKKGDIRFLIFLREDIYKKISDNAREPDKLLLNTARLEWNDENLLLSVIEDRFMYFDQKLDKDKVWDVLFCKTIKGINTKKYIFNNVIKRPRDLIYLIKSSINESINHRNTKIEEKDLIAAQKAYFEFLVSNTVTEYRLFLPEIRNIIYSFYKSPKVFNLKYLKARLKPFKKNKLKFEEIIEFLINISFLGMNIEGDFLFSNSESDTEMIMNQYLIKKNKFLKEYQFKINYPYFVGLQG